MTSDLSRNNLQAILVSLCVIAWFPGDGSKALATEIAPVVTSPGTQSTARGLVSDDAYHAILGFYGYDDMPLDARVVERVELPTHVREKVVFNSVRDERVPGFLGLPRERNGPFPVVLLIDGIIGSKSRWWEEDSWPRGRLATEQLIDAGFAVLALDAQYHGERIVDNDYESPGEIFFSRRWFHRTRNMFQQTTLDYRRAMDYLETRPDIDADRIGALGLSMGGIIIFGLNASDPRLAVSVAGVTPLNIFEHEPLAVVSPYTFARGVGQRPFLVLMGRNDPFYSESEVASFFELIEGAPKELVVYDADHRLPAEYVERARSWFETHLK